jgi:hypothetical protein
VDLDGQRKAGPRERTQMVDTAIAGALPHLAEAGSQERRLGTVGVVDQQIEIAEPAQPRAAVVERHLGALEHDEAAVPGGACARQQRGSGELVQRRQRRVRGESGLDSEPRSAPAP